MEGREVVGREQEKDNTCIVLDWTRILLFVGIIIYNRLDYHLLLMAYSHYAEIGNSGIPKESGLSISQLWKIDLSDMT